MTKRKCAQNDFLIKLTMKLDFYLQRGINEAPMKINPIYKDDFSVDIERESGQMFFRKKINGKISLLREDYDKVMEGGFDVPNFVMIFNNGTEIWRGKFMRTDCTINYSDRILSVQPDVVDDYNDILDAMDNEVNLVDLPIANAKIVYQRRPIIQVLLQGAQTLSNFIGGLSFEQETKDSFSETQLKNEYYFLLNFLYSEINIESDNQAIAGTYYGKYTYKGENNAYTAVFYKGEDNPYYLVYSASQSASSLLLYQGSEVVYEGSNAYIGGILDEMVITSRTSTATATVKATNYPIYARYILDVDSIADLPTYDIPKNDIVENSRNYRKCIGYGLEVITASRRFSSNPTKYGQTTDGRYYQEPQTITGEKFYPICQSAWTDNFSFWFSFHNVDAASEKKGRADYILRHAWEIGDVLNALLRYNNITATHSKNASCSQILYGTPPNNLRTRRLFITPKSNIIVGDYNNPANVAKSSLRDILALLKNAFNIYWHIGKVGNTTILILEHISYYENGGSYTEAPIIGNDLTNIINTRNGKKWSFAQSEITYDKEAMPERYQYTWMDETTTEFGGYPIVMRTNYVQKNKIEDVQISNFTSDLDYVLLNSSAITMDGFMVFGCKALNLLKDEIIVRSDDSIIPLRFANNFVGKVCRITFSTASTKSVRFVFVDYYGEVVGAYGPVSGSATEKTISTTIPKRAVNMYCDFLGQSNAAYLRAVEVNDNYEVAYYNNTIDNVEYSLQNGDLAMINLQPKYLTYNMPTENIMVNNMADFAHSVKRAKRGSVAFPITDIPDPKNLIKTDVGIGEIEKISLNLQSNSVKADLRYDTE